jgi:hypothetical protein
MSSRSIVVPPGASCAPRVHAAQSSAEAATVATMKRPFVVFMCQLTDDVRLRSARPVTFGAVAHATPTHVGTRAAT